MAKSADSFLCRCSLCARFWKETFGDEYSETVTSTVVERSYKSSTLLRQKNLIKIGDRVSVALEDDEYQGVVKYIGLLDEKNLAPKTYVGVKLDENIYSVDNGAVKSRVYFSCPKGHGVMVPYTIVTPLNPPEGRPPVYGNEMFPSYDTVKENRKLRLAYEEELKSIQKKYSASIKAAKKSRNKENTNSKIDPKLLETLEKSKSGTEHLSMKQLAELAISLGSSSSNQMNEDTNMKFQSVQEKRRIETLREQFGGGARADTMIATLKKLQAAYEKGKELNLEGNSTEN